MSCSTPVAALVADRAAHLHPAGRDQLAGLLARAGQLATHQFGVQAQPADHERRLRPGRGRRARPAARGAGRPSRCTASSSGPSPTPAMPSEAAATRRAGSAAAGLGAGTSVGLLSVTRQATCSPAAAAPVSTASAGRVSARPEPLEQPAAAGRASDPRRPATGRRHEHRRQQISAGPIGPAIAARPPPAGSGAAGRRAARRRPAASSATASARNPSKPSEPSGPAAARTQPPAALSTSSASADPHPGGAGSYPPSGRGHLGVARAAAPRRPGRGSPAGAAAPAASSRAGSVTPVSTSSEAQSTRAGALDVGVEPVADHHRVAGPGPFHALGVHGGVRFAGGRRGHAGGVPQRRDQRTVARQRPARGRHGGVEVGRQPRHAPADRHRSLGQRLPVDARVRSPARRRPGRRRRRRPDAGRVRSAPRSGRWYPAPAPAPGRQPVGQVVRGRLGGGDHLGRVGGHPDPVQQLGDLVGASGRRCWSRTPAACRPGGPRPAPAGAPATGCSPR